jgi:hypothetical protein
MSSGELALQMGASESDTNVLHVAAEYVGTLTGVLCALYGDYGPTTTLLQGARPGQVHGTTEESPSVAGDECTGIERRESGV